MAPRTTQQAEEPEQLEEEDQITTPESLGFQRSREIEVERVQITPEVPDADGYVQVRMAETIEEFTYGNPHLSWRLEEGKIYRVPRHIAGYLDSLGKLYHR